MGPSDRKCRSSISSVAIVLFAVALLVHADAMHLQEPLTPRDRTDSMLRSSRRHAIPKTSSEQITAEVEQPNVKYPVLFSMKMHNHSMDNSPYRHVPSGSLYHTYNPEVRCQTNT